MSAWKHYRKEIGHKESSHTKRRRVMQLAGGVKLTPGYEYRRRQR